jgi:uncharacterized membrane protein YcaP (DUF421 family)
MHFVQVAVELIVGFVSLFLMTKILGKATLAQVTAFDFISAIVLGELVGNALYDKKIGIGSIVFAVALWGLMIYTVEWSTQKFRGTRKLFEGKPTIVIRNGHMDREAMRKEKLDINMLQNLLRHKDVFSIREVAFAILETDGSISVKQKSQYATPTMEDLQKQQKPVNLPITIIEDGEVDWDNLKEAGLNEEWLLKNLRRHHIRSYKDVYYCEWKKDEGIFIEKMNENERR